MPSQSTIECNNLQSQILAKLADVKEKLSTNSKMLAMSPSPNKENKMMKSNSSENESSSEDDEYTLNTGRLRQFSLKTQQKLEDKAKKSNEITPKEKEIREEIMKSNSKIKHYYYKSTKE